MSNIKYSEKDMAALIGEVEAQFADHLRKAEKETEQTLVKSEDNSEETVNTAEENKTLDTSVELEKNEEELEFSYDEEDYAEMDKLYGGMTKAEAEAHYKSVKKALYGDTETTKEEVKMEKSEENTEKIEKSEDLIAKSEFDALKEENDKLKKSIEDLTNAVKNFNKNRAPKQKAVTKIEYIKKSEVENNKEENSIDISSLTKSEIAKKLSERIRKGASPEDKEKINSYYMDNKSIETIKHLL